MENLTLWSLEMEGAKKLLCKLQDMSICLENDPQCKVSERKVYSDAIYRMLKDSRNMDLFLIGGRDICYRNHKRDKKGKLTYVEAYIDYGRTR